jgi:signal transduction histidine kinase
MRRLPPGPAVLVACGLTAFVAAVYAVLVLGGGALLGEQPGRPGLVPAIVATALVAVGIEPVRGWLRRHLMATPDDVLAGFAGVATADVCPRTARLLADATGARSTEVRLLAGGEERTAARWPAAAGPISAPAHVRDVRHAGETIGRLVLAEGRPLTPREIHLLDELADRAGPALRNVLLTAEVARRVAEEAARAVELRASRQRIVATADAARMRLERDIHDSAQQHLVALTVRLRLAETVAGTDPERAAGLLGALRPSADAALATLADLAAGIYPRTLVEEGPAAALRAAVTGSAVPVAVTDTTRRRYGSAAESVAYFGSLEAVQNAVKHAGASRVEVALSGGVDALTFTVCDDGHGFAVGMSTSGSGLMGMHDRIESAGGTLVIASTGAGTTVTGRVPVAVVV